MQSEPSPFFGESPGDDFPDAHRSASDQNRFSLDLHGGQTMLGGLASQEVWAMIKVSEIFYSYQGEGPRAGMPAVFLRLATCNLKCGWCDTPYTWDWKRFDRAKEVQEMSVGEILSVIGKFDCKNLVLTGGEPLLQQKKMIPFLFALKERGFWIEVETNGTLSPSPEFDLLADRYNCSPKLKNSGQTDIPFSLPPVAKAVFKFVVCGERDLEEIGNFVERHSLPRNRVYLMPEGRTREAIQDRESWVARASVICGYRFTTRRHVLEFGGLRGV